MTAVSPAEWAQMLSLAVALYGACSAPYFLLVDAERWARPHPITAARAVVWDVSRSEAFYPLLRGWNNAPYTARRTAAQLAVALLLLVAPHTPETTR